MGATAAPRIDWHRVLDAALSHDGPARVEAVRART